MCNKIEKTTAKNELKPLSILLLLKLMNLKLCVALLSWVKFATVLVLLLTFLLQQENETFVSENTLQVVLVK